MIKLVIKNRTMEKVNKRSIKGLSLLENDEFNTYLPRFMTHDSDVNFTTYDDDVDHRAGVVTLRMYDDNYDPDTVKKEFIKFYKKVLTPGYIHSMISEIETDKNRCDYLGFTDRAQSLQDCNRFLFDLILFDRLDDYKT